MLQLTYEKNVQETSKKKSAFLIHWRSIKVKREVITTASLRLWLRWTPGRTARHGKGVWYNAALESIETVYWRSSFAVRAMSKRMVKSTYADSSLALQSTLKINASPSSKWKCPSVITSAVGIWDDSLVIYNAGKLWNVFQSVVTSRFQFKRCPGNQVHVTLF